jgi:hypothetical protein
VDSGPDESADDADRARRPRHSGQAGIILEAVVVGQPAHEEEGKGAVVAGVGLPPERPAAELPPMIATDETSEWLVITGPRRLVFPTHTDAAASYFAQAGGQAAADRARYEPDGRPSRNSTTRAAGFSS